MNLLPGTILAQRYRIDALLGEGGMGAVYRATDYRGVGCALKVMRPEHAGDPDIRRRFEQEARIGMHVRHPNVRQVWDAGVDAYTQLPYLAMELLNGEDLASRLAWRGALPIAEVGHLLSQLTGALAAAHAAGIVHRDLKPENLFLSATHAGEVLKVLDFGIAKVLAGQRAQNSIVIGTPAWMAPEQLGEGLAIGPPTDVWAVGLLAFFALTGRSYFPSANTTAVSYGAVIVEVLDARKRVAASARAVEYGLGGNLPGGGFDAWFARCTAVDPRGRYQDVASCWAAFREVLGAADTGPVSVSPRSIVPLEEEDAVVERAIAEIERRMPAALAAGSERPSVPMPPPRDSQASPSRPKIALVKGRTPVPSQTAMTPYTPSPGVVHTPAPQAPVGWNTPVPPSSQAIASWAPPAEKSTRFGALFLDVVIAFFLATVAGFVWNAVDRSSADSGALLCFFVLYLLRDVIGGGRSIGKRAFELQIIDVRTGHPIGLGEALTRQLVSFQVLPGLGFLIDSVMALTRPDGRRSGDILVRTQVVKRRRTPF